MNVRSEVAKAKVLDRQLDLRSSRLESGWNSTREKHLQLKQLYEL
jgi:hypothetical protein